ncbi:MAG: hypothetical protein PHV83_06065 [Bacteroidales bacterium]|nr:hypothetical protein [Bacteroidales bacterium]
MGKALIGYFLPEGLLGHFNITNVEELGEVSIKTMVIQVELEEINIIPRVMIHLYMNLMAYAMKSMC